MMAGEQGVGDAACQLAFGVQEGPQEEPGTARSKGQGCP